MACRGRRSRRGRRAGTGAAGFEPRPCQGLPRRLCRPRHGARTIDRTPHSRVRSRAETTSRCAMKILWAPWRMAYVGAEKADAGCIFCHATEGDPRERLLLGTTAASLVMLNRYPYASGHLMVAPRRHTASLPDLP